MSKSQHLLRRIECYQKKCYRGSRLICFAIDIKFDISAFGAQQQQLQLAREFFHFYML